MHAPKRPTSVYKNLLLWRLPIAYVVSVSPTPNIGSISLKTTKISRLVIIHASFRNLYYCVFVSWFVQLISRCAVDLILLFLLTFAVFIQYIKPFISDTLTFFIYHERTHAASICSFSDLEPAVCCFTVLFDPTKKWGFISWSKVKFKGLCISSGMKLFTQKRKISSHQVG